jgi:hypothetical protein
MCFISVASLTLVVARASGAMAPSAHRPAFPRQIELQQYQMLVALT